MPLGDAIEGPAPESPAGGGLRLSNRREIQAWDPDWRRDIPVEGPALTLMHYWQIVWKHRFIILIALGLCLALGAAATMLTTPVFTGKTTLQIDRESAKVINLQDVVPDERPSQGEEFYQTQYGLLKSRALVDRVITDVGALNSPDLLEAIGVEGTLKTHSHDAQERRLFHETVLRAFAARLQINPVRGSRLVNVQFNSTDPQVAARIANSFAENFIASNLERRFESSSYAREFLEKRISQLKSKLEDSERQIVAYATEEQIINLQEPNGDDPGATQSLASTNLAALNSSLAQATADRIRAEERWRDANRGTGMGITEVLQDPTIQALSQQQARQTAEYQQNLRIYKPDFPVMLQLKAEIDDTRGQLRQATKTIRESMRSQYEVAAAQERALQAQVNQLKGAVLDLRGRSIQYNILQREVDTNRTLYDGLLQRYKEIGVTGGVTTNNISIVDRAEPPTAPSAPNAVLNMALAMVMGLGLGGLGAFVAEALDQAIRLPTDVEAKLGLPLLGSVPILTRGVTPTEAMRDPRSAFWEAYYSIRTALQFSTANGVPRSLLVTSSRPSEGKSTTSLALAQSFARLGARTLLVDADLRKPSLHNALGQENDVGVSNFLTGASPLAQIIRPTAVVNLYFAASGPLPPSPAELLAGDRLHAFLSEAEREFDVIIFDGPPVMGLADAPMIAAAVAATIVVIEAGKTGRHHAAATIRRLKMAQGHLTGVVLTKFDARKASYGYGTSYEFQYNYDYGKTAKPPVSL